MGEFNVLTVICVLLAFILPQTPARHYDIEAEAQRLYGEDLASVLRKFRRSTDYMYLLKEKSTKLMELFDEVCYQVMHRDQAEVFKQKLRALFGISSEESEEQSLRSRAALRAPWDPEEAHNTTQGPVWQLDNYVHTKHAPLNAHEKNSVRDIAFEVMGLIAHKIIDNMGPADAEAPSTRLGDTKCTGNTKSTTERDHRHTIGPGGPSELFRADMHPPARAPRPPAQPPIDETLRVYTLPQT